MSSSSPFSDDGGSLAQEAEAENSLQKANFDLKMQVFNLQEMLRKSGGDNDNDTPLKLALEEKDVELTQRNVLLAKAKEAIGSMKKELEKMRREHDPAIKQELEERIAKLKKSNEDLDTSCREQMRSMEFELVSAKEKAFRVEEEKALLQTTLEKVQDELQHAEARAAEVRDEKYKLDEEWLLLQQKAERMEEEVTQARAHVELFRLETQEAKAELESMRSQLIEARDSTHVEDRIRDLREDLEHKHHEELAKHSLQADKALHTQREEANKQMDEMKLTFVQEKGAHEVYIQQLTQRHEADVARIREEHSRAKEEQRVERQREREEHASRMDEKTDEIRALHAQLELARGKAEHLLKEAEAARVEMESTKVELSFRSEQADEQKNLAQQMHAEVTRLKHSHEKAAELTEALRRVENEKEELLTRTNDEKEALQHKLDHALEQLEALRHNFHDKESRANMAEAELSSIKASHSTVETISRDNEKLKTELSKLTNTLLQATHEAEASKREVDHVNVILVERERKLETLQNEIVHLERENASMGETKDELSQLLKLDREKNSGMEAILAELHKQHDTNINDQKQLASQYKNDFEDMEKKFLAKEMAHLKMAASYEQQRHDYITALQVHVESLETWDADLTYLADGITPSLHTRGSELIEDSTQSITRQLSNRGFLNKGNVGHITDDDIGDHFAPTIVALTERVKIKMGRVVRLRSHMQKVMETYVAKLLSSLESSNQRAELLNIRVTESNAQMQRMKAVLDRDRRAFEHEKEESQSFREQLLEQHNLSLSESEARVQSASRATREVEDRMSELQKDHALAMMNLNSKLTLQEKECDTLSAEIKQLKGEREQLLEQIATQKAEIEAYGQADSVVQELSGRLEDLMTYKDELAVELDGRNAHIAELEHAVDSLRNDSQSLMAEKDEVNNGYNSLLAQFEGLKQKLAATEATAEHLRASQITPELAQMIRDTQSIMASTKSDNEQVYREVTEARNDHHNHSPQPQLQQRQLQSQLQSPSPPQPQSPIYAQLPQNEARQPPQQPLQPPHYQQSAPLWHQLSPVQQSSTPLGSMLGTDTKLNGSTASGEKQPGTLTSSSGKSYNKRSALSAAGAIPVPSPYSAVTSSNLRAGSAQTFVRSPVNFTSGTPQRGSSHLSSTISGGTILRSPKSRISGVSAAAVTPNTQVRQSVSRLHKLGSDIEALARKLDGFDVDKHKFR